jgi:hypothetical protein
LRIETAASCLWARAMSNGVFLLLSLICRTQCGHQNSKVTVSRCTGPIQQPRLLSRALKEQRLVSDNWQAVITDGSNQGGGTLAIFIPPALRRAMSSIWLPLRAAMWAAVCPYLHAAKEISMLVGSSGGIQLPAVVSYPSCHMSSHCY